MRIRAAALALLVWACGTSGLGHDPVGGAATDASGGSGSAGRQDAAAAQGGNDAGDANAGAGGRGAAGTTGGAAAGAAGGTPPDGGVRDGGRTDEDGAAVPVDDPGSPCLDGIVGYAEAGPFAFRSERQNQVRVWVPEVPAGCKIPVVHFSNGTGASCSAYKGILEHLASHGFLTACYESTGLDAGENCMTALHTVVSEYRELAALKFGLAGQHTGGAMAVYCAHRAEREFGSAAKYAGYALAPASGTSAPSGARPWAEVYAEVETPFLVINGSEDFLVSASWVADTYEALGGEKYWYEATGAPHVPVPVEWATKSIVVFLRWKLLGDEAALDYFRAMPDGERWELKAPDPGP